MPVNDTTTNRGYQKPNLANTLADDVGRLRSALDSIDADMAGVQSPITQTAYVVSENVTFAANRHGFSLTSVEVASGISVEVPAGATWTIAIF